MTYPGSSESSSSLRSSAPVPPMPRIPVTVPSYATPDVPQAPSPAGALAPAPGGYAGGTEWGTPPVGREGMPSAALWVLWGGVVAVGILYALPDPTSWQSDSLRAVWRTADLVWFLVLGAAGLLARRGRLAPGAVVLWVVGGALLLLDDQFLADILNRLQWYDVIDTVLGFLASLMFACFAAAYLAVRRSPGVRYAFVPVVLVVELIWYLALPYHLIPDLGYAASGFRLVNAVFAVAPPALMALIVFLAGKVGTSSGIAGPVAAGPGWPQQWPTPPGAWPAQQQWPVQQQGPFPPGPQAVQPAAPWGYAPYTQYGPPRTNTLAIVALVLGIVGVNLGGIICGHIALSQIRRTGEGGRGMAIAGLVLGYLWVAVVVILLIAAGVFASSSYPY